MTVLASQITQALAEQLATCRAPGYPSDVGRTVLVGQPAGLLTTTPCVVISPGASRDLRNDYGLTDITRAYEISGFLDDDTLGLPDYELVDQIAYDIRRCIAAAGTDLTSLIRDIRVIEDAPGYRDAAAALLGCVVSIEIDFSYSPDAPDTPVS